MKFSSKTFTTPSTLILIALLATFIYYLYFRKSSHDMDLDFYDYDSEESEDDYMKDLKKGKEAWAKEYKTSKPKEEGGGGEGGRRR